MRVLRTRGRWDRRELLGIAMLLLPPAFWLAWVVRGGAVSSGARPFILSLLLGLAPMPAGLVIQHYFRRRSVRYLKAQNCQVCLTCRYPLQGIQSPGVCPECGVPFNTYATVIAWRRTYPELHRWPIPAAAAEQVRVPASTSELEHERA
jgi:hypothetical protein